MLGKEDEYCNRSAEDLMYQQNNQMLMDSYKNESLDYSPDTNMSDNGNKRFHCDICDATFTMIGNLNRHKKGHSNHRPYTCDFCLRGFLRRTSYIEHIRLHTGEKPYQCTTCHQTFVRKKCHQMHVRKCTNSISQNSFSQQRAVEMKQEINNKLTQFADGEVSSPDEPLDLSAKTLSYIRYKETLLTKLELKDVRRKSSSDVSSSSSDSFHLQYPKPYVRSSSSPMNYSLNIGRRLCSSPKECGSESLDVSTNKEPSLSIHNLYPPLPVSISSLQQSVGHLWPCKFCQIFFADQSLLIRHMEMHSVQNPMTCTVCLRTCRDAHEFLTHH